MFQAQNRETINSTWKVAVIHDHYDDDDKIVLCKTTPDVQETKTKIDSFGLRPVLSQDRRSQTTSLLITETWFI